MKSTVARTGEPTLARNSARNSAYGTLGEGSGIDSARQTMTAIVGASLPQTSATIKFDEGYPPMAPTEGNAKLLAMYDRASRDLGFGAVTAVSPDRAGAADVSFVAADVKRILDGVGLMGHDDHTANETADLTTLPSQTTRMAVLLYRIMKSGVPK